LRVKSTTTEGTDTDGHGDHLVHGKLTNVILKAAYRVHSKLGPGLLERPYRVCMAHELNNLAVRFEVEKAFPVIYDGSSIEFGYRVDLLVEKLVIVEIKAVENILPIHEAQLLSYLKLSGVRVGLLINFNVTDLRQGIMRRVSGY